MKGDKVQPYGHHAYRPVFGFVEAHPGLGFDGQRMMGLAPSAHFIFGGFRSVDRTKYFSFVRHYNNHGALGFTAFEADTSTTGEDSDFRFDKRSTSAYQGAALANQRNGVWGVRDIFDGTPRFEVRASVASVRWLERDLVDISAEWASNVVQICVPDAEWPLVYNTRSVRAKGTFLGHEVEGWMQMDCAYLPDGKDWFSAPYITDLQGAWSDFITEYEDGSVDHGILFCGKGRFNAFCVESSDRAPIVVNDPAVEWEFDDEKYPIRFSVDAGDGEVWDWQRLPGNQARIPSTHIDDAPRWMQGRFTRRGDARTLRSADGWMESFERRLLERSADA